jgi:hypothetical protein
VISCRKNYSEVSDFFPAVLAQKIEYIFAVPETLLFDLTRKGLPKMLRRATGIEPSAIENFHVAACRAQAARLISSRLEKKRTP